MAATTVESPTERSARLAAEPWQHAGSSGSGVTGTIASFREIWEQRRLLGLLTRRELKSRYKDSAGGFLWSLARPLTQLFIYYLVIGEFLSAARNIENFAIYIFAGLTVYTLFSEIVGAGTGSIIANAGLVKKVYLPREIFPLAAVGSALFNFVIQLAILIIASLVLGTLSFGPQLLFGVGALMLILVWATAIGLLLSALNVYLRDIQYLVEVVLLLLMWGSPILYSWQMVADRVPAWLLEIYVNNPITLAVLGFQEAFWSEASNGVPLPHLALRMGIALAIGIVAFLGAQRVFSRLQGDFAQEL
ncbi:ABC transporter permease [Herbiconiux moechotypicola]|uniref:Transport permease protein n=1 Tax=Herbiconiux moechotypicola TaxID=637393 RepID=A0ABN3DUT2_9MICO|nr:ABC transporter permease [Herbiconiux moechotypicola]MCS5731007.1 ABC transporter permease [Herbiconiux moechotypicola]